MSRWFLREEKKVSNPKTGPCFNCQKPLDEGEYCFGCRAFICNDCDQNPSLMGGHDREEHLHEEGADDE